MATPTNFIPIIGTVISIGGIIFQIGTHAERLNKIGIQVEALEKKDEFYNKFMHDINSRLLLSDEKLKNIESDVKFIKNKIIK